MTIDLDSGTGLFDRLGRMGHVLNLLNAFVGGAAAGDLPTEIEDILEEYDGASTTLRDTVEHLINALASQQSAAGGLRSALRTAAENTLIEMAHADNPLPDKTVEEAAKELIAQMVANSETVDASEPSVSVSAAAGNNGNGNVVASVTTGKGKRAEHCLAEDVVLTITATTTAGQERFTSAGEDGPTDKLAHDWPAGSASSKSITNIDAASTTGNVLVNSDFEDWTANVPDNWTLDVGAANTDFKQETTTVYKGSSSAEYDGDASTLTAISQDITTASTHTLVSRTPYAVNFWVKADVVPAAGALVCDLYDGTSVIADDEGTNNTVTVDLTAVNTSFVAYSTVFRLPEPVPSTVKIRLRLTTAISSGTSVFVDHLAMAKMTEQYSGGPWIGAFSGATNWAKDDKVTVTVTNARAGALQELCDKFFNLSAKELLIPSATGAAETVNDALIG